AQEGVGRSGTAKIASQIVLPQVRAEQSLSHLKCAGVRFRKLRFLFHRPELLAELVDLNAIDFQRSTILSSDDDERRIAVVRPEDRRVDVDLVVRSRSAPAASCSGKDKRAFGAQGNKLALLITFHEARRTALLFIRRADKFDQMR